MVPPPLLMQRRKLTLTNFPRKLIRHADICRIPRKVAQAVHGTGIDQSVGQNAREAISVFAAGVNLIHSPKAVR
jgi:hypothetical protein